MGTETVLRNNYKVIKEHYRVKLNNPQMGTETIKTIYNFHYLPPFC